MNDGSFGTTDNPNPTRRHAEVAGEPQETVPPPPGPKRIKLRSASNVAAELARLYRDARSGRTHPAEATKLAHILDVLRRCLEASDIEKRLALLEATLQEREKP
jgi:hypothetical protein